MSIDGLEGSEEMYLTAEDMRQFVYCPRIIYFRYVMLIQPESTFKMQRGEEVHQKGVRSKSKEVDGIVEKYYNLFLKDADLNIASLLDYLEFNGTEAIPVDIKTGHCYQDPISDHHLAQLIFQALIVEKNFKVPVMKVKVIYTKEKSERTYAFSVVDKLKILKNIEKIRKMVQTEVIPPPVLDAAKCTDCEFWRYCQRA